MKDECMPGEAGSQSSAISVPLVAVKTAAKLFCRAYYVKAAARPPHSKKVAAISG
jgi:hypothetical protein